MLKAALALLLLASLLPAGPAEAQAACRFQLGFRAIAEQMPDVVGRCLENEHFNSANGDTLQRTTGGLLAWRKADNWTAFTDGHRTWVNGPFGLEQRLNTERFDWEAPPVAAAPVPPPPPPAAPSAAAGARACTVVVPGRAFGAVFHANEDPRPSCEGWARSLRERLRSAPADRDFCSRVRGKYLLNDDTCRSLQALAGAEPAVADAVPSRGGLVCAGHSGAVRFAVLDVDQQQLGQLFCSILEDAKVPTIRA